MWEMFWFTVYIKTFIFVYHNHLGLVGPGVGGHWLDWFGVGEPWLDGFRDGVCWYRRL